MAYQNVGTPRFYINVMDWLHKSGGLTNSTNLDIVLMNPSDIKYPTASYDWNGSNNTYYYPQVIIPLRDTMGDKSFVAHLGHNFSSCGSEVQIDQGADNHNSVRIVEDIINCNTELSSNPSAMRKIAPAYDGFSIYLADYTTQPRQLNPRTRYDYIGGGSAYNGLTPHIGSTILGSYYDMPHSPDLKLTMTREMDGVKRIRTKGGADLVDHKYIKPPMWGDAGAWELYEGTAYHQELSRSGRRVWDLSFSYLQSNIPGGGNLFAATESQANRIFDTGGYTQSNDWYHSSSDVFEDIVHEGGSADIADYWNQDRRFLEHDNFYSQVIHKTNGGQLPFIFQPDKNNNAPDGFAICKFDSGFKFEQVANGVYNVKLKIREVW